jgi:O-antigen/teichoic acid export membrane protein
MSQDLAPGADTADVIAADAAGEIKKGSHVLGGSVRVALIIGIQAILASAFWFEAARLANSKSLGTAAALYTSLQFVNYLTGMGVAVTLARYGGAAGRDEDAWFGWSIVYTCAASLVGTIIYLEIVASPATDLMRGSPTGYLLFFLLTATMSLGPLVDVRLIASRSWTWLMVKNLLIGLTRLPLAFLHPFHNEALWLFTLIAAPQAIFGALGVLALPRIMQGRVRLHLPSAWRQAMQFSLVNWLAVLSTNAPAFVIPLIVALHVKPSVNAAFFLASNIAAAMYLVPTSIAVVVLVEGARDAADFKRRARHALLLAVGVSVAALIGSIALAPLVTVVYGHAFRLTAEVLPVLLAACVPWSVAAIKLSEARLRHDHVTTVVISATIGVGIVTLGIVLVPILGPWGAVWAWVSGNVAASLIGSLLGWLRWRSSDVPASVLAN